MPVQPLDALGVGSLPGRRKSCLQSRNVAKQSLANQLEEVEGKFWILKIKLCHLGIADYEHFSTFNARECEGALAVGCNQSKFADYLAGPDLSFDFD
jgi:hypothetical protein